MTSMTVRA